MLPKALQQSNFGSEPIPSRPGCDHAGGQTEERHQSHNGIATAWLLDRLLRVGLLIGGRIRHGQCRAINDLDVMAAPKVLSSQAYCGFTDQSAMDVLQWIQRKLAPGLAVGARLIGRDPLSGALAETLSLADGFATGSARLGDLPKETPEDQPQIPATAAGMSAIVLLSQQGDGAGEPVLGSTRNLLIIRCLRSNWTHY